MPQSWSPGTLGWSHCGHRASTNLGGAGIVGVRGAGTAPAPSATLRPSLVEQQCPAQDIKWKGLGLKREMYLGD